MTVDWSKMLVLLGGIAAALFVTLRVQAGGGWWAAWENPWILVQGFLIYGAACLAALFIDPDSTL